VESRVTIGTQRIRTESRQDGPVLLKVVEAAGLMNKRREVEGEGQNSGSKLSSAAGKRGVMGR